MERMRRSLFSFKKGSFSLMPRKKTKPVIDPTIQAAEKTSRRALIGAIVAALITLAGGVFVAFINGWFADAKPNPTPDVGIYRVRVTVIDPQNVPIEDAKVWSSFGGEPKQVAGGWEFDIPTATAPKDDKLTIFASKDGAFLTGQVDVILSKDRNSAMTIRLKRDNSAKVRGQVVDRKQRGVAGAHVFIVGYENEGIITESGGNFELAAHAAPNERVLLYAQKGRIAVKYWHPAGDYPALLKLSN